MQNNYTRIENKLVMVMERPKEENYWDGKDFADLSYKNAKKEYNSRPSYPINPADLDKFEFGRQYEEGRDFEVKDKCSCPFGREVECVENKKYDLQRRCQAAFPIHKPNDIHPETFCQECGGHNPLWSAENELFNKVNGSPDGIICPICFYKKAKEKNIDVYFRATLFSRHKPNDMREEKQKEESDEDVQRNNGTKYTYYRVDFKDWSQDFDYTICESLDGVRQMLQLADVDLDDPERKTKITIRGVGMTPVQYKKWLEENED